MSYQDFVDSSNPSSLTNVNGTLYFKAFTQENGTELWRSNGDLNNTLPVKDLVPGPQSSNTRMLTNFAGQLQFVAPNAGNISKWWKSDGTDANTQLTPDSTIGTQDSNPTQLVNVGGTLFFTVFVVSIAANFTGVTKYVSIAGAFSCTLIAFTFPGICGIKLGYVKSLPAKILMGIWISLLTTMGMYGSYLEILKF